MASRSKSIAKQQQKCRKFGTVTLPTGPLKATQSFGLTTPSNGSLNSAYSSFDPSNCASNCIGLPSSKDFLRCSSPDSPKFTRKERSSVSSLIRRSSSFDAISSTQYLNGTWPRAAAQGSSKKVHHHHHHNNNQGQSADCSAAGGLILQADRETQTLRSGDLLHTPSDSSSTLIRSSSLGTCDDQFQVVRNEKRKTSESHANNESSASFFIGSHPLTCILPSFGGRRNSGGKCHRHRHKNYTPRHSRGSLEGLDQELENLSSISSSSEFSRHDGRRAPITDLLVSDHRIFASVSRPLEAASVTSTDMTAAAGATLPVESDLSGAMSFVSLQDSGIASNASPVTTAPPSIADEESPESVSGFSLSDLDSDGSGMSPPKFILTRLPPDGCESIVCKVIEKGLELSLGDLAAKAVPAAVLKPVAIRAPIPSEKSAFYPPLCEKYVVGRVAQTSQQPPTTFGAEAGCAEK